MSPFRLVVVESSAKIAKVSKYLGPGFKVVATLGHFRDLPEDELGVETSTWRLDYVLQASKQGVVSKLKQAAEGATEVLLATDADREGEAISWHVAQVLGLKAPRRVRFREITAKALKQAVAEAAPLDLHLVDAQQARRVVDRLVGYQVSPLLRAFGSNHSAGRVQSPTLQVVVKRELEREAFKAVPFWTLTAFYEGFEATAARQNATGEWAPARFESQQAAVDAEKTAREVGHQVEALDTQRVEVKPKAPFTTSTMQQSASAQLGFKPKQTMQLAQALFEKGVITYHRTDSVALSDEAIELARTIIAAHRSELLPEQPPRYRSASDAQEAHEAIRPTAATVDSDTTLSAEEEQLLGLIHRRFLASQCKPSLVERTVARIVAGPVRFLATGNVVVFDGFRAFLQADEDSADLETATPEEPKLPRLKLQQQLPVRRLELRGDKTKSPPRFTQATLIKEMTRLGIGRPSTLEPTLSTLFERTYLAEEKKAVLPTPRGRVVAAALCAAFPDLMEAAFTAQMEERLDEVAGGRRDWRLELTQWHRPFEKQLQRATGTIAAWYNAHREWVDTVSDAPKSTGKSCPRCSKELLLKTGKNGAFLSCSGYPTCSYSVDPSARASTLPCPVCAGPMEEVDGKYGKRARCVREGCTGRADTSSTTEHQCPMCAGALRDKGEFLGCSHYPSCKFSIDKSALTKAVKKSRRCPRCQQLLVEKRGPRGKFVGCITFPRCRHAEDAKAPVAEARHG